MSGEGIDPHLAEPPFAAEPGPPATRFGEVRRFARLDSTNRYLLDLADLAELAQLADGAELAELADQAELADGGHDGLVAVADHQTAGRGRLGRRWEAPAGANLLMSVLLFPDLPVEELYLCTAAVALAAAEACGQVAGLAVDLKWPNDLLVGERKIGGILAESRPLEHRPGRAVVVGLGLNVGWPPPDEGRTGHEGRTGVPSEIQDLATSIWRETGGNPGPRTVLHSVLTALEPNLVELGRPQGRRQLMSEYRSRCSTVGQEVRVTLPDREIRGVAIDVTPEGHLIVDVGACFTTVTAGDVVHVRRAG